MLAKEKLHHLLEVCSHIREHVLVMTCKAKSGHPGGSLSMVEILVALYFQHMNINPAKPNWEERDYFVLAKGHGAPALYAVLAEKGYFPKQYFDSFRQLGSKLQGHPDKKSLPGVEMSTGSLGQGLSVMVGMALGLKLDKKPNRVYGILGDGELQEGQVWEAAMSASHFKLDNLVIFVDKNGLQIDGSTESVMNIDPLVQKWESFGWEVNAIDGHNMIEIVSSLEQSNKPNMKPKVFIASTVKG